MAAVCNTGWVLAGESPERSTEIQTHLCLFSKQQQRVESTLLDLDGGGA